MLYNFFLSIRRSIQNLFWYWRQEIILKNKFSKKNDNLLDYHNLLCEDIDVL